jgi:hypothetical protein
MIVTNTPETVLKVIQQEKLPFKIMLGAYIVAEMNNFGCPLVLHIQKSN